MTEKTFRDYSENNAIEQFYKELHTKQTVDYAERMIKKYKSLDKKLMTIWEAFDMLAETERDISDPDINKLQDIHSYQTAEACRKLYPDEKYDWFHLTGFIHDLGKILCHPFFGLQQWEVVGDKNPVGAKF